mmetsp:Transcript_7501/g.21343  ORF Transcript_7501/g.21343 Transcript_7501/m.21343 type:complete len:109 (-) Transcript_7501:2372-2698(-)
MTDGIAADLGKPMTLAACLGKDDFTSIKYLNKKKNQIGITFRQPEAVRHEKVDVEEWVIEVKDAVNCHLILGHLDHMKKNTRSIAILDHPQCSVSATQWASPSSNSRP